MTSKALQQPMINRLVPLRASAFRVPLQIAAGIALMALLAQIRIQVGPVPITGQTLGVLLVGAAYGLRLGGVTLALYLLAGGLGLPVFTDAGAGWAYFAGPTAGYLLGFPLAAMLVGYLSQRGWDRRPASTALAMLLGNLVIYLLGLSWLARFAPASEPVLAWTLAAGLAPFLAGDALKLLLAAGLLPGAWRLLGRRA
ncbi:MAG TPA: biotin transporter BioY [Trueperaceae bacterium]